MNEVAVRRESKIKVLLAKPGTDGHSIGLRLIAQALRQSGMEVVYLGSYQTTESIVRSAIQENVDVVGLSLLSGSHLKWFPEIAKALRENGAERFLVVGGGLIAEEEKPILEAAGVVGNFGPGTPTKGIIEFIRSKVAEVQEERGKEVA